MRRILVRSLCLAIFLTVATCAVSDGQPGMGAPMRSSGNEVSISYFYESLSPNGQWFPDPSYGWCWTPYDVAADWRPYSDGHWEYTDYGWSWASNEPWGWATYHYGRWFFDDSYGWAWVPGTEWAPAWVAWRYGDDYVGWAPLPPTAGWDESSGLAFTDASVIPSSEWCFVPRHHVMDVSLRLQVTSVGRNVTFLERSRDVTHYEVRDGRPANVGLDVAQVESGIGRRVVRVKINDVDRPARGGGQPVGNGAVGFFRPRVRPEPPERTPAPAMTERRMPIADSDLQRLRDSQQKKLESDLNAEHARLERDQQNEMRTQGRGPAADDVRKRHAAELQAFEAHAVQQRQVFGKRMEKQVVNPNAVRNSGRQNDRGKGKGRDNGQDKGRDKGGN